MGRGVSAEAAAIAREAQMRSEASEAARIAYVTQARTLRERRGSYIKMVIISALVAAISSLHRERFRQRDEARKSLLTLQVPF